MPRRSPQSWLGRRAGARTARLALAACVLAGAALGCRRPAGATQHLGAGEGPLTRGGAGSQVAAEDSVTAAWEALTQARATDPGSAEVADRARSLLDRDPPLAVRLAALDALAEHAYLAGDDGSAVAHADAALALVDPADRRTNADARDLQARLLTTRVSALVRGGDPAEAAAVLGDPEVLAVLDDDAVLGLRAVALDRNADVPAAIVAYVRWRERLTDDDPAAPWAEHRARVLAAGVPAGTLVDRVQQLPPSGARLCVEALAGRPLPAKARGSVPGWVERCALSVDRIGVLLPRHGKLSALADEQLEATAAALEVLTPGHGAVPVLWEDPGSSAGGAKAGARRLADRGADVIVGPIGPALIDAATREVGGRVPLVIPGEGQGMARGVAPSLEARVARLVDHARASGKTRLIVLAPDNAYGRRVAAAASEQAEGMAHAAVVRHYDPSTTSFKGTLSPLSTALSTRGVVLVADHLSRAELLVRQLARLGKMPASGTDDGLWVMTTAEGASATALDSAGTAFEGVWASPAASSATAGARGRAFARAYTKMAGESPGDHAMLVYYAMHLALTGRAAAGSGRAPLVRVVGGEFVAGSAATGAG